MTQQMERRQHRRAAVAADALVLRIGDERYDVVNIGRAGARVRAQASSLPEAGATVSVQAEHGGDTVSSTAEVVWVGGGFCGLKFLDPEPAFDRVVEYFVSQ